MHLCCSWLKGSLLYSFLPHIFWLQKPEHTQNSSHFNTRVQTIQITGEIPTLLELDEQSITVALHIHKTSRRCWPRVSTYIVLQWNDNMIVMENYQWYLIWTMPFSQSQFSMWSDSTTAPQNFIDSLVINIWCYSLSSKNINRSKNFWSSFLFRGGGRGGTNTPSGSLLSFVLL